MIHIQPRDSNFQGEQKKISEILIPNLCRGIIINPKTKETETESAILEKARQRNISVITLSAIKYKMTQDEEIFKFGMCYIIKDI